MPKIRKTKSKVSKKIAFIATIVVLIASIVYVAIGVANAGTNLKDISNVGIGNTKINSDTQVGVIANTEFGSTDYYESANSTLATYSTRDITTALTTISYSIEQQTKIAAEAAKAAAEAAKAEELIHINKAKNNKNEHARLFGMPPGLTEINWDSGKDAFLTEWTNRINFYLQGSPLAGNGSNFANAAWENLIDPRWSPAISNTESSKGTYCFAPYNAWGWGTSGWSNWSDAIWSHVGGLSDSYGYTITYGYAKKYCPPNYDNWYNNTLTQMAIM